MIHDILKAVLGIFHPDLEKQDKFNEWSMCKQMVNPDLVRLITSYDPTARANTVSVDAKSLAGKLQGKCFNQSKGKYHKEPKIAQYEIMSKASD